jgi:hypothetical protein
MIKRRAPLHLPRAHPDHAHWSDESSPPPPAPFALSPASASTRADHPCGPLVPALRPVLSRRRGAAGRAGRRGRPRHRLPLGAAGHAAAGRGRPAVPPPGWDRWFVDETKVAGGWRYVYRAIDQFGQVIDVFVFPRRDARAARRFFEQAKLLVAQLGSLRLAGCCNDPSIRPSLELGGKPWLSGAFLPCCPFGLVLLGDRNGDRVRDR